MLIHSDNLPARLTLGRAGENLYRELVIDWSEWLNAYPSGALTVVIKRPDGAIYPALTGAGASPAVWRLTDTDLGVPGIAEIELRLYVGEVLGKSAVMQGVIAASLGTPAEPPEAVPDWVGDVAGDADRAEAARTAIEDMTVSAVALPAGSDPTVTKTTGDVVNLEFGIPSGGGGGGTGDHAELTNRDAADQHPQSAITGLTDALAAKYVKPSGGIPATDLASDIQADLAAGASAYQKPAGGMPDTDMTQAVQASLNKADTAYQKPASGIPATDMAQAVQDNLAAGAAAYRLPAEGIPAEDMAQAVQDDIAAGASAYQKPAAGIPSTDMAQAVQASLGRADTAYQKPASGIPAADMAQAVQDDIAAGAAAYQKPASGIPATDMTAAVQASLDKADTALQTHQDISGLQPKAITDAGGYFSTDTVEAALQQLGGSMAGKVDVAQGAANAGRFLVVGNDGNVALRTLAAWQGGSY